MKLSKLLLLLFCLTLSACQVELYSDLDEKTANEMLAVLNYKGIQAEKQKNKKSTSILIEKSEFSNAVNLLKSYGLPKAQYSNLGTVFEKQGLISSPAEEWARFVYARGQELAQSISKIDGIISANVHLSIEKKRNLLDKKVPPRASVMIEHFANVNTHILRPQIKQMIVLSVDGLTYDNVSLMFSPVKQTARQSAHAKPSASLNEAEAFEPKSIWWFFWPSLLIVTALTLLFLFFDKLKQIGRKNVS